MLDVAIVGAGLCGLALAHSLQARRVDWAVFEARPRLGGRVHTVHSTAGLPLDLGPTWFWPATQPSITRLVADLGLPALAQPDDGRVLLLDDPNRAPRAVAFDPATGRLAADEATPARAGALHGGARRLAGGMAALIDALARRLPAERLQTNLALRALVDRGSHVELHFVRDGEALRIDARRAVLALPPRLAAALLRFEPPLPDDLASAMAATPTWMASAAKTAVACERPAWRASAGAGNAWVTHPQAVLAEVFDAGPADAAAGAALAGFLALDAAQRPAFRRGLGLLVDSQLAMLFGDACSGGEQHAVDWADEAFTCTEADRQDDARAGAHPEYGDARLQQPLWQGRLWLGGSETARHGGGYLEGALSAAARLRTLLTEAANDAVSDATAGTDSATARQPGPSPVLSPEGA
jgi:monoamine oxidase